MYNILIIGYGVVGKKFKKDIESLCPDIYDKYNNKYNNMSENKIKEGYDIAFICVDTPNKNGLLCDYTEIINAINENLKFMKKDGIFVIKSTVLPKQTELINAINENIVFSPEFYGNTQHNDIYFDFTILGGKKENCIKVIQILQNVYKGNHMFKITDAKTASLVKYMSNSWLATKVSFCNQFFRLAENLNIDYEVLRELFILDPRVNPSHTFVYRDKPYWDSHCLNKDVKAIAYSNNAELLKEIFKYNELCKKGVKNE